MAKTKAQQNDEKAAAAAAAATAAAARGQSSMHDLHAHAKVFDDVMLNNGSLHGGC